MANHVYEQDGVVYGASYDKNYRAEMTSTRHAPLPLLLGSKYAESDVSTSYQAVKADLLEGRGVLYCAAPCQISGLKAYLGRDYSNLFTVDFICGGFGASGVFAKYIQALQEHEGSPLSYYRFRSKVVGWHSFRIHVKFENGHEYYLRPFDDPYYLLFRLGYIVRDSCFSCPYLGEQRSSDITLADYLGENPPDFVYDKVLGLSQVLINTEKGSRLFEKIEGDIFFEPRDIALAKSSNPRYHTQRIRDLPDDPLRKKNPYISYSSSADFWEEYKKNQNSYFASHISRILNSGQS